MTQQVELCMCVFIIRLKMFLFFLGRDQVTLNPPSVIGSSPRLLGPSQCFFFIYFFYVWCLYTSLHLIVRYY